MSNSSVLSAAHPIPAQAPRGSATLVLTSIALLLLLAALDQTIVATALPTIVAELGGLSHLSWVVTAYVLASTIVAPLYGKLGDMYGRRRMVFVSVGLFLAGSALCGVATSMAELIAARAVQGLGGGGLFVLALSVVGDVIPPRQRGRVQGIFAAVFSMSSVAGPLAGGWLVEVANWHWIFFINIPFGVVAIAGFAAGFAPHAAPQGARIDWAGAAALSTALAALTLLTSLGGHDIAWTSPQAVGLGALAVAAALAFAAIERRAAAPILPPALARQNVFVLTSAIGFAAGAVMFGATTFLPIFLQVARGVSPTDSGLMLVPMTLGVLTAANLSGRYMGRTGRYKALPAIGTLLAATGAALLTRIDAATPLPVFAATITVMGLGLGCIFPVVTTAVQNAVPRDQLGTATAAGVMFRQVGGSLAVAAFGAIFAARMAATAGGAGLAGGEFGAAHIATLDAAQKAALSGAITGALTPIWLAMIGLAALGFVAALLLKEIPLANRMVPRGE